jgi:SAM-dependent methyltransferase
MHNDFTGERIVWKNPGDHLKEFALCTNFYMEAMERARGKRVLDLACGTGFGSFLLSTVAKEVVGIDGEDLEEHWEPLVAASPGDLRYAMMDFETEKIDFGADLTVSIETIEHLANPDFFLSGLRTPELFFTIPCYGDKNEFHKIEYNEEKAAELIRRHFPILEYRMQGRRMIGFAQRPI